MKNIAVIGANYGDESKGRTTDYHVKKMIADGCNPLVIRYSGSNNATHTVYKDAVNFHAFSSIGSGSYRNAPTYLSPFFIVDPVALAKEIGIFKSKCKTFSATVFIDPQCRFVTPYDVALNRIKEHARSAEKHGSTGNGLNECIERNLKSSFRVKDKLDALTHIKQIQAYFVKHFFQLQQEYQISTSSLPNDLFDLVEFCLNEDCIEVIARHFEQFDQIDNVVIARPDLKQFDCVFEGSQGLALDEDYPNFPYVTRSKTGVHNILVICQSHAIQLHEVYYLSRVYLSRHGFDPNFDMRYHGAVQQDFNIVDVTNVPNDWQGSMKYGYLDVDALEQRINDDFKQAVRIFPRVNQHRVFSCVDQIIGPYRVIVGGQIKNYACFEDFKTDYYPQDKNISSFVLHRSAVS